jgi:hypothetical protein
MVFDNLALSSQQSAKTVCDPLPIGIGFGIAWPLGGPSVAQGPPKRDAREAQASNGESALFAIKVGKGRVGWRAKRAYRRDRATSEKKKLTAD